MPDANAHLNCNDLGSLEQYPFKICGNKKIIYVSMTSGGQTTEEITFNVDVSDAAPAGTEADRRDRKSSPGGAGHAPGGARPVR